MHQSALNTQNTDTTEWTKAANWTILQTLAVPSLALWLLILKQLQNHQSELCVHQTETDMPKWGKDVGYTMSTRKAEKKKNPVVIPTLLCAWET